MIKGTVIHNFRYRIESPYLFFFWGGERVELLSKTKNYIFLYSPKDDLLCVKNIAEPHSPFKDCLPPKHITI